ncbi:uncharacterized protein L3040_007182 [Drepanopeziza brunnea f. sp. 'multigermtubi']|uniref:uncharacterized protein n=1 Tax=Drepanopeziza brunnea f. sp. 'multigermtubi' TaxID=698441 RepID=UPI0023A0C582|nr:hypothetical protein L3040_007182 [Drepanopeziza brunnea f. sp. 'multigermtubi']
MFTSIVLKYLADPTSQLIITLLFGRTWVLNGTSPWAEAFPHRDYLSPTFGSRMKGRKLQYPGEFERTARLKELLSDAQRFIITTNRAQDYPEHCDLTSKTACPPTEQTGLKQTMDWLLDRIEHTNDLAGKLMQHVLPGSQDVEKHFTRDGTILQDDLVYIMKIRLGADSRDTQRPRNPEEPGTNAKLHTRRRFLRYLYLRPCREEVYKFVILYILQ